MNVLMNTYVGTTTLRYTLPAKGKIKTMYSF